MAGEFSITKSTETEVIDFTDVILLSKSILIKCLGILQHHSQKSLE
jgi:hypothetical protein